MLARAAVTDQRPVISLFSGAGCLDLAVERCAEPPGANGQRTVGPFTVAVATDYEPKALRSFHENFGRVPTVCGDIRDLSTRELLHRGGLSKGEAELVVGGPPCTPFSKSGFWLEEKRSSSDPNASLLDEYARVVEEAQPRAFVLENVQGLTYATHRAQLTRLIERLSRAGYDTQFKVLLAADYGDPQLRRRVFVLGRRDGARFSFPEATHSGWSEHSRKIDPTKPPHITAQTAIGSLVAEPEKGELAEGNSRPGFWPRCRLARTTFGTQIATAGATSSNGGADTGHSCCDSIQIHRLRRCRHSRDRGWDRFTGRTASTGAVSHAPGGFARLRSSASCRCLMTSSLRATGRQSRDSLETRFHWS